MSRTNATGADGLRVVVIGYERAELLINAVASVKRHLPGCSLHVVDDGSTSVAQRELLSAIAGDCHVIVRDRAPGSSSLGGLYHAMNEAMDRALHDGHEWVLFMQDDQQVVRPAGEAVQLALMTAGAHPDVVMASIGYDKWMSPGGRTPCPDCSGSILQRSLSDTGLINVQRLADHGLRFGPHEAPANRAAKAAGLRGFAGEEPFVAFVPWPRTFRGRHGSSRLRAVRGPRPPTERLRRWMAEPDRSLDAYELLLEATPAMTLTTLDDGTHRRFAELNVRTVGWSALSPFGYGEPWRYLAKQYLRTMLRNDGRPRLRPRFTRS